MTHSIVYREPGRYAGWPANYGIWSWGNDIVVGFVTGYHDPQGTFHARDTGKPFELMQARSTDGGETWSVEAMPVRSPGGRAFSADEHQDADFQIATVIDGPGGPVPFRGDVDLTHPDLALMCARTGLGAGTRAWFYMSTNRCRTWDGPFSLPMFGQSGVAARTDYVVLGPRECLLFLTAAMESESGSRVFCARTQDSGQTFSFLSWVSPPISEGHDIMPATVRLSGDSLLTAIRTRSLHGSDEAVNSIDLYESNDRGASWVYKNRPVASTGFGGNPPTLTRLSDSRLCITYGHRTPPFGIRAVTSSDDGASWSDEIVLRADGGSHDLGYPRAVQRPDGSMVTVYYFNEEPLGACHIAATIWQP